MLVFHVKPAHFIPLVRRFDHSGKDSIYGTPSNISRGVLVSADVWGVFGLYRARCRSTVLTVSFPGARVALAD